MKTFGMTKSRDEFPAPVRRALALRANYRCSFPGCSKPTSGPSDEADDAVTNIGVAAHISAAAPGGPRYRAEITSEQRRSIANAIWLCRNHGELIDEDTSRYTEQDILDMKIAHEEQLRSEVSGLINNPEARSFDLIAIGPNIVVVGELVGAKANEWRVKVEHFVIGGISDLVEFPDKFDSSDPYDRYILVNSLGDGRQLTSTLHWEKIDGIIFVSCPVAAGAPRTDGNHLPWGLAINENFDLSIGEDGRLASVSGLKALPQTIKNSLSTVRGEMPFNRNFGSRIAEYLSSFSGSPWLSELIKSDVIRFASIPYPERINGGARTPLQCVKKVVSIEELPYLPGSNRRPFRFVLEIEGVGCWGQDVELFAPVLEGLAARNEDSPSFPK